MAPKRLTPAPPPQKDPTVPGVIYDLNTSLPSLYTQARLSRSLTSHFPFES